MDLRDKEYPRELNLARFNLHDIYAMYKRAAVRWTSIRDTEQRDEPSSTSSSRFELTISNHARGHKNKQAAFDWFDNRRWNVVAVNCRVR